MKRLLMLIGLLVLIFVPVFCQTVPADWLDLYENYGVFFATYLGIAGIACFLGEYVIRLLKLDTKLKKVTAVWLLAILVSFFGSLVNIGFLSEATWWETLLWGALAGVAANGIWASNLLFLKQIMEFLIGLIKVKVSP